MPQVQLAQRRAAAGQPLDERGDAGGGPGLVGAPCIEALEAAQPRRRGEQLREVCLIMQRPQVRAAAVDKVVARRAADEAQRRECWRQ